MFRVDNLQAGDMIIWKGEGRTMGIVIDTNPDPHGGFDVVIEFYDGDGINPLHYYYHELDDFLEHGEIRIQHG